MSTLTDIFTEAFLHRLLPYQHELALGALRSFNHAAYVQQLWLAGAGALVASALLYAVGIWLRRMPEKVSTDPQRARIEKIRIVATTWLPWLLILAPTPVGGILVMAAGFFAISPLRAGTMILAAEILWRVSPLL